MMVATHAQNLAYRLLHDAECSYASHFAVLIGSDLGLPKAV